MFWFLIAIIYNRFLTKIKRTYNFFSPSEYFFFLSCTKSKFYSVIFSILFQSCGNPVPASDIPSRSDNMSAKGYLLRGGKKKGTPCLLQSVPYVLLLSFDYGIGHKDEDF